MLGELRSHALLRTSSCSILKNLILCPQRQLDHQDSSEELQSDVLYFTTFHLITLVTSYFTDFMLNQSQSISTVYIYIVYTVCMCSVCVCVCVCGWIKSRALLRSGDVKYLVYLKSARGQNFTELHAGSRHFLQPEERQRHEPDY